MKVKGRKKRMDHVGRERGKAMLRKVVPGALNSGRGVHRCEQPTVFFLFLRPTVHFGRSLSACARQHEVWSSCRHGSLVSLPRRGGTFDTSSADTCTG